MSSRSLPLALLVCLGLAACGRTTTTPDRLIDVLRAEAEEHPRDATAQRRLAIGELFLGDGDPARAAAQIDRALTLAPSDATLHFLRGQERQLHGELEGALAAYLDHLEAARAENSPMVQAMSELAASTVVSMLPGSPGEAAQLARIESLVAQPGLLSPAVRHLVAETVMNDRSRRGDAAGRDALGARLGCVQRVRVAGPFGPRTLLGFDVSHPAGAVGAMAERYDLGPISGERATREVDARGCVLGLGGGPIASGGTFYVESFVEVPAAGDYVVRLDTPHAAELAIDDERVVRRDTRTKPWANVTFHRVHLAAGRHELRVKMSTNSAGPALVVALLPASTQDLAWLEAGDALDDDAGDVLATYLEGARAIVRVNTIRARERLDAAVAAGGGAGPVLVQQSAVALGDPHRTPDMRRDRARRILSALRERDGEAWYAVLQLAALASAEGRVTEAVTALREAKARFPKVPGIYLTLAELLLTQGWEAEADEVIAELAAFNGNACATIDAQRQSAVRRDRWDDIERLARAHVACDAESAALFGVHVDARRWDEAEAELARLRALEPASSRSSFVDASLAVAKGRGDEAAVEALLREAGECLPRNGHVVAQRFDQSLASGSGALTWLETAIEAEPSALVGFRSILADLGGRDDLADFRRDGLAAIRAFEAASPDYEQPQVLVLDYNAVRIYEDGSSQSLIHQVFRLQSEEAVDAQGEFSVPQGAELLRLRTIKANGAILEPDLIEGKETISLPNLAVGDYVEFEARIMGAPSMGLAGGSSGSRFYFQSFDQPFFESELVYVYPPELEPTFDPRGPAPEPVFTSHEGLRVARFRVEDSRPLVQEPSSVSAREFVPSVTYGVGATWDALIGGIADVFRGLDVFDPEAHRLVRRILAESPGADAAARAEILYEWVLDNVEPNDEIFGQAATMIAARTGQPARVLAYLYRLAGIPARLVMVRSFGNDQTRSEVSDDSTYSELLIEADLDGTKRYVYIGSRGVPFGYMPATLAGMDGIVIAPTLERVVMPAIDPAQDRRLVAIEGEVAATGAARLHVVETFHGAGAIGWRTSLEGIPAAVLEQRFEAQYAAQVFSGASLVSLTVRGREDLSEPLVLDYVVDVPSLGHREGQSFIVARLLPLSPSSTLAPLPERTTTQLVLPTETEISMTLRGPTGARFVLPSSVTLRGPSGARFVLATSQADGAATLQRRLSVPRMRVAPEDYEALRSFARQADAAESRPVRLQLGGRS